jgi:hypothetical protein
VTTSRAASIEAATERVVTVLVVPLELLEVVLVVLVLVEVEVDESMLPREAVRSTDTGIVMPDSGTGSSSAKADTTPVEETRLICEL